MTIHNTRVKDFILKLSGLIAVAIIWEMIATVGVLQKDIFPSFFATLKEIYLLWTENNLYMHIMSSLWRFTVGIIFAMIIGIPLGIILSESDFIYKLLGPLLKIFAKINPFSLLPIIIALIGTGESVKMISIIWVGVFPILFATASGIHEIDSELIKTAKSMKTPFYQMIYKVYLPAAGHSIFTGIRVGVEMTFFMIVAGEMLGANSGLGYLIHKSAHHYFDAPKVYGAGLLIMILGVLINGFFRHMQNGLFFWKEAISLFHNKKDRNHAARIDFPYICIVLVVTAGIIVAGADQIKEAAYLAENPTQNMSEHMDMSKNMDMNMNKEMQHNDMNHKNMND